MIDQLMVLIFQTISTAIALTIGMYIGTRTSAKAIRREIEDMMSKSEALQLLKKTLTDQTLTAKATKFFEEATVLVSSSEAKNFFKNVTELMKELGGSEKKVSLKMPKKSEDGDRD